MRRFVYLCIFDRIVFLPTDVSEEKSSEKSPVNDDDDHDGILGEKWEGQRAEVFCLCGD